jgi:hypothetical protein
MHSGVVKLLVSSLIVNGIVLIGVFYKVAKQVWRYVMVLSSLEIESDTTQIDNFSKLQLQLLKTQYALYDSSAGSTLWDI